MAPANLEVFMQSNQIALFDVTDFEDEIVEKPDLDSVSYTHLTLPTIYSV